MPHTQSYFADILGQFYQKSVKNHTKKQQLIQKQKDFFQKWQINQIRHINASSRSLRGSVDSRSSRGGSVSRQKESSSKFKRNDQYFQCSWLFQSSSFEKTFVYCYFYFAIQHSNTDILDYIQAKFIEDMQTKRQFDEIQQKKISHYWSKIRILISKKEQVRWEKILQDSLGYLPEKFLKLVFFIVSESHLDQATVSQPLILKISKRIGIKVNFYHVKKKQIVSQFSGKVDSLINYSIKIVYIQQLNRYMMSDKQLKKPDIDESVQKIFSSFGVQVQKLLLTLKKDDAELQNLDNMCQETSQMQIQSSSTSIKAKR